MTTNINWQYVLTTVGGTTGIVLAIAWLARSLFTHQLTRDVEAYKARLKAQGDIEIERLRNSLQIASIEHQVRFSNLHEKQAQIIADVYTKLVVVSRRCESFVLTTEGTPAKEKRDEYNEMAALIRTFVEFVEDHKIYLPDDVLTLVDRVLDPLRKSVFSVGSHTRFEFPTPQQEQKIGEAFTKAYEAFNAEIPQAKNALVSSFRRILGVSSSNS